MKLLVHVVAVGFLTTLAAGVVWGQTATKPPAKPATAANPAATTPGAKPAAAKSTAPGARSAATAAHQHSGFRGVPAARRAPVFVPPPPVIEIDEMPAPDLPTVLSTEERDGYRRIFQAQASGQWAAADAEIAKLTDKTLMGYVGNACSPPATRRATSSSQPGCRTTTTIPTRRASTGSPWRASRRARAI
jgi:soluble lytic murein transglycosylase